MSTKYYTLISYLESEDAYIDRCGDFNSGKPSEMTIKSYSVAEYDLLVNDFAQLRLLSDKNYRETHLLFDGIDSDYITNNISEEDALRVDEERRQLDILVDQKYLELKEEQEKKETEAKQKALALKKIQDSLAEEKIRQAELQKLAALQAKYKR